VSARRYCDYYSQMSFADFTAWEASGNESHEISTHTTEYLEGQL